MPCIRKYHTAALFFSLIILVPLLLIVSLQGWQIFLKHQWEERLEGEAVQTIKVAVASVVWQEAGREFTIDGQFFDVISYRTESGFVIATGMFDKAETRIATFLATHTAHAPQTRSVVQLLFVMQGFAVFLKCRLSTDKADVLVPSFFPLILNRYPHPFTAVVTPPPRLHFYGRF